MGNGLWAVIGADKGHQNNSMPLRQVPQHMILPHLGTSIERIGQDLCQEQDAGHSPYLPLRSKITDIVCRVISKSR
jgi:hypothetical protein